MTSLGYQIKNKKQTASFHASSDFRIGAYAIEQGEPIKVVSDGYGLFHVYVGWADGALGRLNANDINKLAGFQAVQ